ncbi:MAG: hypothetical protein EAZ36_04040 [Verrucomicrobia bacterium]|nr:MAG: hypothetical protein EAZ36_04040 [Verrucomicrobiota bacterium]
MKLHDSVRYRREVIAVAHHHTNISPALALRFLVALDQARFRAASSPAPFAITAAASEPCYSAVSLTAFASRFGRATGICGFYRFPTRHVSQSKQPAYRRFPF